MIALSSDKSSGENISIYKKGFHKYGYRINGKSNRLGSNAVKVNLNIR